MKKEIMKREINITLSDKEEDKKYIKKLNKNKEKVKYLRFIKEYTQIETSELVGITKRQVQRIEKQLKMSL